MSHHLVVSYSDRIAFDEFPEIRLEVCDNMCNPSYDTIFEVLVLQLFVAYSFLNK